MNNKTLLKAIEALNEFSAYTLANMADVHTPDTLESSGAVFLTGIRDSVAEQLEYYFGGDYADVESLSQFIDSIRELSTFDHEIPDGAPSIYNYERMRQLVDLAAWDEDVSDYGEANIITAAGYVLYNVARRLVEALLQEVADFEDGEEYEDDE